MCCLVGKQPNSLTRGQPLIPPAPSPPAKALGAKGGQAVGSSSPPAKAPGAKGGQAVGSSSPPAKALGAKGLHRLATGGYARQIRLLLWASTVWRQVATRGRWLRAAGLHRLAAGGYGLPSGGLALGKTNSPTRHLNYPARLRPPSALGSCLRPSDR